MVVRISDKTQNYSKVTKLLVKPLNNNILTIDTSTHKVVNVESVDTKTIHPSSVELKPQIENNFLLKNYSHSQKVY